MKEEPTMDVTGAFADHVLAMRFDDLPDTSREAARRLILDAFGVGLAGSSGQWTEGLSTATASWGHAGPARVFGERLRFPAGLAALRNAYSIHNSEFDSLHEDAVVHALTAVLPAALSMAEQQGGVSGLQLIEAVCAGIDIAAAVGLAGTRPMKFFRPAVAGGFGAVAAAGKIAGLTREQMVHAFGAQYAQSAGAMQAHEEGTMLLALQIGFNARAAVEAVDLARSGLIATRRTFEGRFGYFNLFEDEADLRPVLSELPVAHHIEQVVEKPFPTGRATHGAIEAVQKLLSLRGTTPASLRRVEVVVSPVAYGLVGRAVKRQMPANYARLCLSYCVARCLTDGTVGPEHFTATALAEDAPMQLAKQIKVRTFEMEGTSAFGPTCVTLEYNDGMINSETVSQALGHPSNPLPTDLSRAKFLNNCQNAKFALAETSAQELMRLILHLDQLENTNRLMDLACPS
ncbi:MmgE/PrpD family protein [Leisingera daeponensis]|uniref:MmgE/PrpD family protein n=1 Tax=Leisingera daeponensis TaxID=405746 RepID=UPI001C97D1DD|nr:MmgE/PrpD family protein [Leisingera daeponensis]MBY6059538.1 MmgE/PrpD family protein [Leisingera daeponensis]